MNFIHVTQLGGTKGRIAKYFGLEIQYERNTVRAYKRRPREYFFIEVTMSNDFSYLRFGYECFLMQALPSGICNIYGDTHACSL